MQLFTRKPLHVDAILHIKIKDQLFINYFILQWEKATVISSKISKAEPSLLNHFAP